MGRAGWMLVLLAAGSAWGQATAVRPANPALQRALEDLAAEPAVARAHWGLSVVRLDGHVEAALNAGQFFQPASNLKLLTTAAAMALLPVDEGLTTQVIATGEWLPGGVLKGDLRLRGVGDANFSGRTVPYRAPVAGETEPPRDELRYVRELAAQVKAAGVTRVEGDVVGDDTLMPWDPYPQDWAWDDLEWYYGAPVSALMIADNALMLTVTPGKKLEERGNRFSPAVAVVEPALPWYALDVQVTTGPPGSVTALDIERAPGSRTVTVRGTMAADAKPDVEGLSIENPPEYAAAALKAALGDAGVVVTGKAMAKVQPLVQPSFAKVADEPLTSLASRSAFGRVWDSTRPCGMADKSGPAAERLGTDCALAGHDGPPLYEDIVVTNKVSQNQHAELLLRQLGEWGADGGTTAQGVRVVRAFLTQRAGVDAGDVVMVDGSGLSGHDLVTPRALTTLLRYAAGQPWGARWKASLPVGGVDGSLRGRFAGALAGRVFAKTGTLGEARALSGYVVGASGRTVAFSVIVTDHTPADKTDQAVMDRMVAAIAAAE